MSAARAGRAGLSQKAQELVSSQMNVGRDLAQKRGRDTATCVKRYSRAATVWAMKLLVRTALPHFCKAVGLKKSDDLPGLEDRQGIQGQATWAVRTSTNSDSRVG